MPLTDEQRHSLQKLKEGLAHMDNYRPVPSDDEPVLVEANEDLHEFATETGQLTLGHLRDIVTILDLGDI